MGSSKGDGIYVYDLTCSTLYYHAKSRIELKRVLKIHPETSKKYVDSNLPYLKNFLLLSHPIPTAIKSNISVQILIDIMQKERKIMYALGTRRSIPVELVVKKKNILVDSSLIGHTLNFDSLTSCIEYLKKLGLIIKRDTHSKYINKEKVFQNFLCKYYNNFLPENLVEVGLIIKEYKKFKKESILSAKDNINNIILNKKNKPLLVKNENFEKEFESILDTIKNFNDLGVKLDRKTLYLRLKDGKIYKGYYFFYK